MRKTKKRATTQVDGPDSLSKKVSQNLFGVKGAGEADDSDVQENPAGRLKLLLVSLSNLTPVVLAHGIPFGVLFVGAPPFRSPLSLHFTSLTFAPL
jgi:hypothetical protein